MKPIQGHLIDLLKLIGLLLCIMIFCLVMGMRFPHALIPLFSQIVETTLKLNLSIERIDAQGSFQTWQLNIKNLQLQTRAGEPVFAIQTLRTHWRLAALFQGEGYADLIEITHPMLQIEKKKNGQLWIAGLLLPKEKKTASPFKIEQWLFQHTQIYLKNAELRFKHEASPHSPMVLSGIQLRSLKEKNNHHLDFSIDHAPFLEHAFKIQANWTPHQVDFESTASGLHLEKFKKWASLPIATLKGELSLDTKGHWDENGLIVSKARLSLEEGIFSLLTPHTQKPSPPISLHLPHVSGKLNIKKQRGTLSIQTLSVKECTTILAQLPLPASVPPPKTWNIAGHLNNTELKWAGDTQRLEFKTQWDWTTRDFQLNVTTEGGFKKGTLDTLNVSGQLPHLAVRALPHYLPTFIQPRLKNWIRSALLGGSLENLQFTLSKKERSYPFYLKGHLNQVDFQFHPNWPTLQRLTGQWVLAPKKVAVDIAQGHISGARLEKVHITLPQMNPQHPLEITGKVKGQLAHFLDFLSHSPLKKLGTWTTDSIGTGAAQLRLTLGVPLGDPKNTRVTGLFSFLGNTLKVSDSIPMLSDLQGTVQFSEKGLKHAALQTHTLGGDYALLAQARPQEGLEGTLKGEVDLAQTAEFYALPSGKVQGKIPFELEWLKTPMQTGMTLYSSLKGGLLALPKPFEKTAEIERPLHLSYSQMGKKTGAWEVNWKETLSARYQPYESLSFSMPYLSLQGQRIEQPEAALRYEEGIWQGTIHSKTFAGELSWDDQERGALKIHLSHFAWPFSTDPITPPLLPPPPEKAGVLPKKAILLPKIEAVIDHLEMHQRVLGAFRFHAHPEPTQWIIDEAFLDTPEGHLRLNGQWTHQSTHKTELTFDLQQKSIGAFLTRLGYPQQMARGKTALRGHLTWDAPLYQFDRPSLEGDFALQVENGQFLKIEPGPGRLLALLSLQSFARRISLNFKDVFGAGFAFDDITGHAQVKKGKLLTQDFQIQSPLARIRFKGEIDFLKENQNLVVSIQPQVGSSVAWASAWMMNPVIGLSSYFLQKLFKDPFSKWAELAYQLEGDWVHPKMTRIPVPKE